MFFGFLVLLYTGAGAQKTGVKCVGFFKEGLGVNREQRVLGGGCEQGPVSTEERRIEKECGSLLVRAVPREG